MPDIAAEIFAGASADYAKSVASATDASATPESDTSTNTQGVESTTQGDEGKPGTSAETTTNDATKPSGEVDATQDDKAAPKGDKAAANLRTWGEGWQKTAETTKKEFEDYKAQVEKELTPLVTQIEEKFGGLQQLELASEIYTSLADAESFNPEESLEWLADNMPEVAEKLVNHIATQVIDNATSTAMSRTFGRELTQDDISNISAFLATGQTKPDKFGKFFNSEDVPDEFKFDKNGDPLPEHITDYLRHQTSVIKKLEGEQKALRQDIESGKQAQMTEKASQAIEQYVGENLKPIDDQVALLGLHKPVEGETPELKEKRELYAGLVEGIALWLAGKDQGFQSIYSQALKSVAKGATDRVAKARSVDFSLRLQKKMTDFAGQAAEIISPLLESLSTTRQSQVDNTKTQRAEITAAGSGTDTKTDTKSEKENPFDDVKDVIKDMIKSGKLRLNN